MLFLLPCPGTAAHADVFDGPAEAGHLVALKVSQADKNVGVHNGAADFGLFNIFAALHRYLHIVSPLQTVANKDGTANGKGCKAILPCTLQMLQGVLPAARVHGIAVSKEGLAPQLLDDVHHRPGVVGAQIADIAQLTEVELDGHKFTLQVQVLNARLLNQLFQLGGQAVSIGLCMEIGEINL